MVSTRKCSQRATALLLLLLPSMAAAFLLAPSSLQQTQPRSSSRSSSSGGGSTVRMMATGGDGVDRRGLVRSAGVGLSLLSGLALLQPEGRCVCVLCDGWVGSRLHLLTWCALI